jgi:hypothetical protein
MLTGRTLAAAAGCVLILGAAPASAQSTCATKPAKIGAALTAKQAFDIGKAEATNGAADSALLRLMSMDALDAQGRSAAWMVEFFSLKEKKSHSINITKAVMFCNAVVTDAVTSPEFVKESEDTIFDAARLIKIAREAAGTADLTGAKPRASLQGNGSGEPARWSISFVDAKGYPKLQVSIDSTTGAVTGTSPPRLP